MYIIEPCCSHRQLAGLRKALANGGTAQFRGFGDMSLTELLPALLMRYAETEMMIVTPSLPDQASETIFRWMRQQWMRADGKGKLDVISHLTIIADLSAEKSPMASEWLKESPFGDRLSLVNILQEETALLLPDIAITGPLNMRYGNSFVCTVTTIQEQVDSLWERFKAIKEKPAAEVKPAKKKQPSEKKTARKKTSAKKGS